MLLSCCLPTNPLKLKKRIILIIKICIGIALAGIVLFIAGVVLTAVFSKHLGHDHHKSEQAAAIVGIVLLILGAVIAIPTIGIMVFIYRKLRMLNSQLKSELLGKGKEFLESEVLEKVKVPDIPELLENGKEPSELLETGKELLENGKEPSDLLDNGKELLENGKGPDLPF